MFHPMVKAIRVMEGVADRARYRRRALACDTAGVALGLADLVRAGARRDGTTAL
jgi:hypothetical protein